MGFFCAFAGGRILMLVGPFYCFASGFPAGRKHRAIFEARKINFPKAS